MSIVDTTVTTSAVRVAEWRTVGMAGGNFTKGLYIFGTLLYPRIGFAGI